MVQWLRKLAPRRDPPGLETTLLRCMPAIVLAGSFSPLAVHALASLWLDGSRAARKTLLSIDIFLTAAVITFWTAVFTVTIACIIIALMKGPGYVADGYAVNDAPRPARQPARR